MKSGDFVAIDYVGRVKDTGEVFDVTTESAARRENVYNPKMSYRPIKIVVDANFIIRGLDDALKEMNVGDKKTVVIEPDKAFGQRNPAFVRPIPMSNFKGQDVDPTPGSWVNINGVRGKILSADGGRIRVDFNHPLAGKSLEYEIEVKKEITEIGEKVSAVVEYMTGLDEKHVHASVKEKEAEIKVDAKADLPAGMKKKIADMAIQLVKGVEKVRFVDEYGAGSKDKVEGGHEHGHGVHSHENHLGHDHSNRSHAAQKPAAKQHKRAK
jgi:FKBP-type peptidyl-prolyl cis-trans isomerase 2